LREPRLQHTLPLIRPFEPSRPSRRLCAHRSPAELRAPRPAVRAPAPLAYIKVIMPPRRRRGDSDDGDWSPTEEEGQAGPSRAHSGPNKRMARTEYIIEAALGRDQGNGGPQASPEDRAGLAHSEGPLDEPEQDDERRTSHDEAGPGPSSRIRCGVHVCWGPPRALRRPAWTCLGSRALRCVLLLSYCALYTILASMQVH
jgi:hypothetical protein